jgi:large subunit ribosomal protein L15
MKLHEVHSGITKNKRRKRLGRGIGSGHGKTAGRGHKGQHSNPGYKALPIWEGGGMPLVRRIPKRGFTNEFALRVMAVNVSQLDKHFQDGDEVSAESLKGKPIAGGQFDILKILGDGAIDKKLKVVAHRFSKTAKEKIEAAGGEVVIVPGRTPVEVKKKAAREKAKQAGLSVATKASLGGKPRSAGKPGAAGKAKNK